LYFSEYWGTGPVTQPSNWETRQLFWKGHLQRKWRREIILTDFKLDTYWKKEKYQKQEGKMRRQDL
jgi:hypothetical protein